jgi:hypothetical protein
MTRTEDETTRHIGESQSPPRLLSLVRCLRTPRATDRGISVTAPVVITRAMPAYATRYG